LTVYCASEKHPTRGKIRAKQQKFIRLREPPASLALRTADGVQVATSPCRVAQLKAVPSEKSIIMSKVN